MQTDGHPFCITGDFDGNGRRDYALILVDSLGGRLIAFHRIGATYRSYRMWVENGAERRLGSSLHFIGIFRRPPRDHGDMYDDGPAFKSPRTFVTVQNYESSSWELVWDGRRYRTFWTSD